MNIIQIYVKRFATVAYSIEFSSVETLREYSDVYGDVMKLGVKGGTSSSVDTCANPGPPMMQDIGRRDLRLAFVD